ncbi:hypothetical protein [Pseudooceanicola nanhaiensis]|uniref:hypothetical protein n=1 Tax=Pseudooceanicola nanhaiensis TaxID=375761 RepID=UPI003513BB01
MNVMPCIRSHRLAFAAALETLDPAARFEAVEATAVQSGGTFVLPSQNSWEPHDVEVSLFGISGSGDTPDSAIRHWIATVLRMERALQEEEEKAA